MIETIAFDFGKVIGYFDHGRALAKLAPHTPLSEQQMFAQIFGTDLEYQFESGRISAAEFVRQLRSLCRLRCSEEQITAAVADIFWPNDELCALIPHLKKRYRLVLGSNTNAIHAPHYRAMFADTLKHFDTLIMSHEIGVCKPERAFYEKLISVAGCPAERCVFVDDMPVNIEAANACGLRGIVYTRFDELRTDLRNLGVAV
ncbi:MAG TPA: HAD family phosphatase [Gemmataceae bacterium]|nr:HAD family phosphatase [Gemmataceae bacterium]